MKQKFALSPCPVSSLCWLVSRSSLRERHLTRSPRQSCMHVTRSFGVAYSICILGGEVAWSRAERPHLRLRRIFVFAGVRASFFRGGLLRRRGLSAAGHRLGPPVVRRCLPRQTFVPFFRFCRRKRTCQRKRTSTDKPLERTYGARTGSELHRLIFEPILLQKLNKCNAY